MSTLAAELLEITYVKPHPNADRLDVAIVRGTICCVVRRGECAIGDRVVYFPPDLLIPRHEAERFGVTKYLKHAVYPGEVEKSPCRVAATRIRGVSSFGFFVPAAKVFAEEPPLGTNVSAHFNAVKYEPPRKLAADDVAPDHPAFHEYTSIEHWWRFPEAIPDGADVRITEKIHGTNSRVGLVRVGDQFEFMSGSHHCNRRRPESGTSLYWEPLEREEVLHLLTDLCDERHNVVLFGEIFGPGVQDMDYGVSRDARGYRVFDASVGGVYLDWDDLQAVCMKHGVSTVPLLYRGPFSRQYLSLTDGPTWVGDPRGMFKGREGIVIATTSESYYAPTVRRVVKSVSADYLARQGAEDRGELAA